MQGISFSRINTKTYNTILCVLTPLIILICVSPYLATLNKLNAAWIFSLEIVKFIVIIACYTLPLTYFLSKIYELVDFNNNASRINVILGFAACGIALLPLSFIGLAVLAKISFLIPVAFTLAIVFIYLRSVKLARVGVRR